MNDTKPPQPPDTLIMFIVMAILTVGALIAIGMLGSGESLLEFRASQP